MVKLVMILLGSQYLSARWHWLFFTGCFVGIAGFIIFIDALDGVIYFPLTPFACLMLIEGLATLLLAHTGIGGQRTLRYVKGASFTFAALLILNGQHYGNFILSVIFGTLFLVDGLLQIITASVIRFKKWKFIIFVGVIEIFLAIFIYQPYPTNYTGTVPLCLGLGLIFGGLNMIIQAMRVKKQLKIKCFQQSQP